MAFKNKEKKKEYQAKYAREWRINNREQYNARAREWRKRNPKFGQNQNLKKTYGITLDQYNILLEAQNYKCSICETTFPGGKGRFHVDHDHITNKVRGLLCHHCNTSLGACKEDILIFEAMILYLKKHKNIAH